MRHAVHLPFPHINLVQLKFCQKKEGTRKNDGYTFAFAHTHTNENFSNGQCESNRLAILHSVKIRIDELNRYSFHENGNHFYKMSILKEHTENDTVLCVILIVRKIGMVVSTMIEKSRVYSIFG